MFEKTKIGVLFLFISLISMGVHAQDKTMELKKAKDLLRSNDLIYEGNTLLNEDVIAAEKEYRKAISKAPSNAIGEYNLGNALYSSGYYDEAYSKHLEAAKKAITKKDRHRAYHNAGNVLMEQELCQEAVEMYKQALRNNPSDDESRYNLALAKECAKQQGEGEGEGEDENEDEGDEKEENEKNEDQKDQGENEDDQKDEGDEKEENNDGDDKEDEQGKPKDEKDNKDPNKPNDQQEQQKPQPGKLSPQQIKNLLEAMNNQEKKVQEKINAKKAKGVKVKVEKDW